MAPSLRNVASLIAAVTLLQLAQGLLGVRLPLAFAADGYSSTELGFVTAAYAAGFMAGAYFAIAVLARVGHIRVFAASAAIYAASILLLHFAADIWSWLAVRLITGAALALLFAAADSWLADSVTAADRGDVMGFHMVGGKLAIALGPFLSLGYAPDAAEPWMIAAAIGAIAMLPVCFTSAAQPAAPSAQPIELREQFATAPAAVIACFGAGLSNGAVLALAPLFAASFFGPGAAAEFYAAAWTGALLLQWPAGRVSDQMDRRAVVALLAALAALSAIALAAFARLLPHWAAVALVFFWGAGALSYYGVAVAHMTDRAVPGRLAQSASGLLFVWAGGAVLGPLILGPLVDWFGWTAVFWFAGAVAVVVAAAMFWRRSARASLEPDAKETFAPHPATSVGAVEIALGDDAAARQEP